MLVRMPGLIVHSRCTAAVASASRWEARYRDADLAEVGVALLRPLAEPDLVEAASRLDDHGARVIRIMARLSLSRAAARDPMVAGRTPRVGIREDAAGSETSAPEGGAGACAPLRNRIRLAAFSRPRRLE
ncbi:hypothetical protein MKK75_10825 [Methylobacterium sp. J-030]|uniref:hypothetical protein n=1 Tax=Methylobacterium sp. J-030 TaxID=2836627 RepID=UPI001FB8756D|nr:hypothetical protein [Methylobacterium sp. J-030]MCJ2069286.1 hypothetical protein [Methylobacterium sp. J-030]